MKQRSSREVIILIVLIPLFLILTFAISRYKDGQGNNYTVAGKGESGYSIIFETLNKIGFNSSYGDKPLKEADPAFLQVVVEASDSLRNDEEVKEWVKAGGSLLLLTANSNYDLPYGTLKIKKNNELKVYGFDKGTIIISNARSLTNKSLSEDTSSAYSIAELLSIMRYKNIFFNEHYIHSIARKLSLWADIPYGIKLGLYQCLLFLILIIFYKGRRFGRTVPYHEEVERVENEYVFSAASLYKKAGCYDIIFDSYFKSLLYDMKKELKSYKDVTKENFLELWKQENLPQIDKAREIQSIMNREDKKISHREYLKVISYFDILISVLRKRSEIYWNQLRTKG